ncbi:MAG: glycosyltransferase family 2 protein [Bombella sp.]|nr:glycosyltransferase family 2 protein [Bombella sp.]
MPAHQFQGFVDTVDSQNGIIAGWAVNLHEPSRVVLLHVLVDGQEVMQVLCDLKREDVRQILRIPSNKLGFRFRLPPEACDGAQHGISIRFDDRTALLFPDEDQPDRAHETLTFSRPPQTEYQSCVDGMFEGLLRGWVVSRNHPGADWSGHVVVSVRVDGVPVGTVRADCYRGDVVEFLKSAPNCGFELPIPQRYHDGLPHEITITSLPDEIPLVGSPLVTALADDQLTAKLVQIENSIAALHQQLTALRNTTRSLIPRKPLSLQHYDRWAKSYYPLLREQTALLRKARPLKETPLVSVLCPTWRPDEAEFRAAVESVLDQTYENWELILVDDGSQCERTRALLREYARKDRRIRTFSLKVNRGIAGATNKAISHAKGAYIAFFDHDDLLVDVALENMVRAALETGARLLYCDEDKVDAGGHFLEPNLKPDYDYRYLLGCNYICHLTFMEADTVRQTGPLDSRHDGAQDHDFLLRAVEIIPRKAIHHVPEILYHWRKSPNSTSSSVSNKGNAIRAGEACITEHLKRRGIKATVSSVEHLSLYSIRWPFRKQPAVSIIIPFRDQLDMTRRCVESLLDTQTYSAFDIILVNNFSTNRETLAWLDGIRNHDRISILHVEEAFNYARLNNLAARHSNSDLLLFLNNDVIVTQPDFLKRMVQETQAAPDVGAVGARLLYPNGTIQHAGVAVGPDIIGVHVHRLQPAKAFGYIGRLCISHEVTAITGAAMLVSHPLFDAMGGFDEVGLTVAYNDVDLCLKIRDNGYRILFCAEAEAVHHESFSRGSDDRPEHEARFFNEKQIMLERWKDNPLFKNDPAYPHYFRQDLRTFFDLRNPEDLWS